MSRAFGKISIFVKKRQGPGHLFTGINTCPLKDMRVLIASLGFAYHHVMASANRCRPGKIVLATVSPENDRTKNAIEELRLYAKAIQAQLETKTLNPEDFWACVGDAVELFSERHEYYLDVGGGVRALALCLFTAATLAVAHLGADLRAVYTMAEHSEKVVEIDLRPLLYAGRLLDPRAKSRRVMLKTLEQNQPPEDSARKILREFEKHGLVKNGKPTPATYALLKILHLRQKQ
mgnify:CR=1 FL=1